MCFFFAKAYIKILYGCIKRKFSLAHLHVSERGSFFRKAILVSTLKHFGVKVILHHHAAEFEIFYDGLNYKKKEYVSKIFTQADINIVLSNRLIDTIKNKAPKASVRVLYNAVNTYDTNPYNNNGKNVLFFGLLGKRKGTYDLLETIAHLDNSIPKDIKFYFCGNGEEDKVKEKVKELGITNRIAYVGWIDAAQRNNILKRVIINVLPSYNEGLPMTILETMAYGIPNISTKIASIPEVISDCENGYLITPGDIDLLEKRLINLINDKQMRLDFSMKSFERIAESFSLEKNIQLLKSYYRELC